MIIERGIMRALAIPKDKRHFTYADYKEWELAEGERYEIIYGEAYAMAAPNTRHVVTRSVRQ